MSKTTRPKLSKLAIVIALITVVVGSFGISTGQASSLMSSPCPHMASMDHELDLNIDTDAGTTPDTMATDCCDDGIGIIAAQSDMADCALECKVNCTYAASALLPLSHGSVWLVQPQSADTTSPATLKPRPIGFDTPPPRI